MKVYSYHDLTGEFIGAEDADESPLEPGVFLIPAHSTELEPPPPIEGQLRRYIDGKWGYSPIQKPEQPPTDEPKKYVPEEIADWRFFFVMARRGVITEQEAEAAVAVGDIPAALTAFIEQLPSENRPLARIKIKGATVFNRNDPLTIAFGAMFGMSSDDIDQLWIDGAAL